MRVSNMSSILLYVVALCIIASTATEEKLLPNARAHFRRFMDDFGRQYTDDNETRMRFEIFKRNLQRIDELNAANKHAVFGITKWADLTDEEKRSQLGGISKNLKDQNGVCNKTLNVTASGAPKAWDWQEQGAVTDVKNQGSMCGSCWAFSAIGAIEGQWAIKHRTGKFSQVFGKRKKAVPNAFNYGMDPTFRPALLTLDLSICFNLCTGAIEGQWAIKHKELLNFSEQQLVDCDDYDQGCFGGFMTTAFSYVISNDGIMLDKDYPYVGSNERCSFNRTKVKASFSSCQYYKLESEETLKELLYSNGPLSIAIDAGDLDSYEKGIYTTCEKGLPDHGVLLVGYGEEKGVPFWRLKNSWGNDFGEKGYFRVERGTDQCGLMDTLIASISI